MYYFRWNDTYSFQGWWDEDEILKKSQSISNFQETCGFYVMTHKDWIVIATHYNVHEGFSPWGGVCWIPKGAVNYVKELK